MNLATSTYLHTSLLTCMLACLLTFLYTCLQRPPNCPLLTVNSNHPKSHTSHPLNPIPHGIDMTKNETNLSSVHSGHYYQQCWSLAEQCHTQIFAWLNSAPLMNFWYDKKMKKKQENEYKFKYYPDLKMKMTYKIKVTQKGRRPQKCAKGATI